MTTGVTISMGNFFYEECIKNKYMYETEKYNFPAFCIIDIQLCYLHVGSQFTRSIDCPLIGKYTVYMFVSLKISMNIDRQTNVNKDI